VTPPGSDLPRASLGFLSRAEWTAAGPDDPNTGLCVTAKIPAAGKRRPALLWLSVRHRRPDGQNRAGVRSNCFVSRADGESSGAWWRSYECVVEWPVTRTTMRGTRAHYVVRPLLTSRLEPG
jgi:hypothetical protein